MPKRTDIQKILIIGSGPIVIGQACEFGNDYPENCAYWQLYTRARGAGQGAGSRTSLDSFVTLCTQRSSVLYECEIGRIVVGVPDRGATGAGGGA